MPHFLDAKKPRRNGKEYKKVTVTLGGPHPRQVRSLLWCAIQVHSQEDQTFSSDFKAWVVLGINFLLELVGQVAFTPSLFTNQGLLFAVGH
jgi:hypothetical protein